MPDVDLIIADQPDSGEICPECGSDDLGLWADDGEHPLASWWECYTCEAHGAVVHPR